MTIVRHRVQIITDTGGNGSSFTGPVYGGIVQVAHAVVDTGIRADTGMVVTMTADTGVLNVALGVFHLRPNDSSWFRSIESPVYDTGGTIITGARTVNVLAGEQVKVSVQGISTDTGKQVDMYLYSYDGG